MNFGDLRQYEQHDLAQIARFRFLHEENNKIISLAHRCSADCKIFFYFVVKISIFLKKKPFLFHISRILPQLLLDPVDKVRHSGEHRRPVGLPTRERTPGHDSDLDGGIVQLLDQRTTGISGASRPGSVRGTGTYVALLQRGRKVPQLVAGVEVYQREDHFLKR